MEYTESPEGQYANDLAQEDEREQIEYEDEVARRLARYDEAIRLLRLAKFDENTWHEADAFLSSEPAQEVNG